jgi:pyruvate formate lyase activating enzyme
LCHNWNLTFSNTGHALNPDETAKRLNLDLEQDHWVGISGGEPTLNRKWLLETIRAIRRIAPDVRIQLDTNASLLTPEYIDELVASGISDISPDLKATRLETFMKVCGVNSEKRALRYLETSWEAVRYLNATYKDQVFMAASVPCHPRTHSVDELKETAQTIASINPDIPVTLIEYQPAFRLRDWPFVSQKGMQQVQNLFEAAGLSKVIIQGGQDIPRAVDPMDLTLSSEEF